MNAHELISGVSTTNKLRYISDILFGGNYEEFWTAYEDECRQSLRTNDWGWLDAEIETYIEQGQMELAGLLVFVPEN